MVVVGVHAPGEAQLAVVVHALDALGFELALAQGRQQQGGQNGDDGDDHEQFDEGEAAEPGAAISSRNA